MSLETTSISRVSLLLASTLFVSVGLGSITASAQMPAWEPDLVPSGANAGECYARVEIPAQYATSVENVMVEEGYSKLEVSQPQLASRQEQVLVKEASVRYEVRQPRYKTVSERMMVRPSYNKLSVTSPQFRIVTETIQTSAPRLVWKRGNPGRLTAQGYKIHGTADDRRRNYSGSGRNSSGQFASNLPATHCGATCEIWCLVEEPGKSTSFNRKVMTSAGEVRRTNVPAKYMSISKQVVAEPGSVREIPVEAQYRGVTVENVVNPGGERRVNVPPKYGTVNKQTLTQPSRYEWRRVVCAPGTLSGARNGAHTSSYSSGNYSSGSSYSGRSSSGSTAGGYSSSSTAPIVYGETGAYGGSTYGGARRVTSPARPGHTSSSYGSGVNSSNSNSYGSGATRTIAGQTVQTGGTQATTNTGTYGYKGTYYYGTDKPVQPNGH